MAVGVLAQQPAEPGEDGAAADQVFQLPDRLGVTGISVIGQGRRNRLGPGCGTGTGFFRSRAADIGRDGLFEPFVCGWLKLNEPAEPGMSEFVGDGDRTV
jgi:hypothetical protein